MMRIRDNRIRDNRIHYNRIRNDRIRKAENLPPARAREIDGLLTIARRGQDATPRFVAVRNLGARILLFVALAGWASIPSFAQSSAAEAAGTASLEGTIRDQSGKPVANASVSLREKDGAKSAESRSNVDGRFSFAALGAGTFIVKAESTGSQVSATLSTELSAGEKKHVDLILAAKDTAGYGAGGPAAGSSANKIEFSDQPNFTIAGMTDWSNLGLHGSDAGARTSEALAKETLALKSSAANDARTNSGADAAAVHRLAGDRYERSNDAVAAVREYEEAVRLDPSEENYLAWGSELLVHRAAQPAVEVFARGSALHPKSTRILAGLGAALYANGLQDEAAGRLCEASDLNPADSAPYLFLGKMEETAVETVPCAEEKLQRFAREQPGNALANYYYALSIWRGKRQSNDSASFRTVEALLKKAVVIEPTLGEAYVALGSVYSAERDFTRAADVLRKAFEVNPRLCEAHRRLGQAYKQTGDEARAEQEFAIYKQCQETELDALERQRRELRQFVVILKDQK